MSKLAQIMAMAAMAEANYKMSELSVLSSSPIFIPRKHTKMKYADHKRMKAKRKNKK